MKTVLVYGDSNTYGEGDSGQYRLAPTERWVGRLQTMLDADKYTVIPEGLSGRVAGGYKKTDTHTNGLSHFEAIYRSHIPVDVLVLALGTNDAQPKYAQSARMIADSLLKYQEITTKVSQEKPYITMPKFIYVLPTEVRGSVNFTADNEKIEQLAAIMESYPCPQVRLGDVKMSSDGVHFDPKGHRVVAERVCSKIKEVMR